MKSPFFYATCFLMLSSSFHHAIAGPFNKRIEPREYSKHKDRGEEGQRVIDWDELLQEPGVDRTPSFPAEHDQNQSSDLDEGNEEKAFESNRSQVLAALGEAFRKAYQRGDENHSDWKSVKSLVDKLNPTLNSSNHTERRLSAASEPEAEAEELQYQFFLTTLPAIKKTSVVAALRAPNHFQTAGLIKKSREEKVAWENATNEFKEACQNGYLNLTSNPNESVYPDDELFQTYSKSMEYQSERLEIESDLSTLHQAIMQSIIEADVCKEDFETRAVTTDAIEKAYQRSLDKIAERRGSSDEAIQDKWSRFYNEVLARCIDDTAQVEKIKLWKNKNNVNAFEKSARQAYERMQKREDYSTYFFDQAHMAARAWEERIGLLEQVQKKMFPEKDGDKRKVEPSIKHDLEMELKKAETKRGKWLTYFNSSAAEKPVEKQPSPEAYVHQKIEAKQTQLNQAIQKAKRSYQQAQKRSEHPPEALATWKKAETDAGLVVEQCNKFIEFAELEWVSPVTKKIPDCVSQFKQQLKNWGNYSSRTKMKLQGASLLAELHQNARNVMELEQAIAEVNQQVQLATPENKASLFEEMQRRQEMHLEALQEREKLATESEQKVAQIALDPPSSRIKEIASQIFSVIQTTKEKAKEIKSSLQQSLVPCLEAQIANIERLYQISQEQAAVEQILRRTGNPVLARHNKVKYFELAAIQFSNAAETMKKIEQGQDGSLEDTKKAALQERLQKYKPAFESCLELFKSVEDSQQALDSHINARNEHIKTASDKIGVSP